MEKQKQMHIKGFVYFCIKGVNYVKWRNTQNGKSIWNYAPCNLDFGINKMSDDSEYRTPFYWGRSGLNTATGNWKNWIIPIQMFSSLLKTTKEAPKEFLN